jgi:hypothetical protein
MPDNNILPPPLYRQAGGAFRTATCDVAAQEKRIRSRGESILPRPKHQPNVRPIISGDRAALAASMHDLFSSEIRAEEPKTRKNAPAVSVVRLRDTMQQSVRIARKGQLMMTFELVLT